MSTKPKGILFDLDDTIISFDGGAESLWEAICEEFAPTLEPSSQNLLGAVRQARDWYWQDPERHKVGRLSIFQARRAVVARALSTLGIVDPLLARSIADAFSERRLDHISLFPHAIEALEMLRSRGISLALMTNGDSLGQRAKIRKFGLADYFDGIFIEEEVGFGKPDKRIYEHALNLLNLDADDVWFVGDNLEWDVAAPQALGIWSIWNDYERKGLPESSSIVPDRIIYSIVELV